MRKETPIVSGEMKGEKERDGEEREIQQGR